MREVWRWSFVGAAAVAGGFLVIDTTFFAANLTKVVEGGYVPLILAGLAYFVMVVWHVGTAPVSMRLQEAVMPVGEFIKKIEEGGIPRVPGTAVFLTRTQRDAPPAMVWHLKHIALCIITCLF